MFRISYYLKIHLSFISKRNSHRLFADLDISDAELNNRSSRGPFAA